MSSRDTLAAYPGDNVVAKETVLRSTDARQHARQQILTAVTALDLFIERVRRHAEQFGELLRGDNRVARLGALENRHFYRSPAFCFNALPNRRHKDAWY